jgi:transposase-like protein
MGSRYSEGIIEQALIKVYSRGDRTVRSVAEELNVSFHTVKNWMKRKSDQVGKSGVSTAIES